MSQISRIVGIVLVRNEDLYVERAVRNIAAFCHTLLLCDDRSVDHTADILRSLAEEIPHASFHPLTHPSQSHDLLKPFVGTPTWVFGVDGDEIYDPSGLKAFRQRLLSGEFDALWRMKGNVLHCLEWEAGRARGHAAPPSRSITKLYNFAAIASWDGDTVERLHGGTIRFQPGFHDAMKRNLQDELDWDASPLRCLHLCFLPRSSRESAASSVRENIMEIHRGGLRGKIRRLANRLLGRGTPSRWKREHYGRGPLLNVETGPFFP